MNKRLLNKITIVILTFNRRQYILRNMKYWSGKDVTVHVLDGSEQEIPSKYFLTIKNNIHYHHLPISPAERLAYVSSLITSKYTMLMGDDEFYIPSAIEACIDELENDVSLVSCFGRCMSFNQHEGALKTQLIYENMADYSVLHSNPDDRVLYHMNNYSPSTVYSVMRTEVWKNAVSCTDNDNELYKVYALEELQFEIASSYLGKSRVLPILLWMRSAENPRITDKTKLSKIHDWWGDHLNDKLREQMLNEFTLKLLKNQGDVNVKHVQEVIARSFELYMGIQKQQEPIRSIIIFQVAKLLSMLPRIIKDMLKKQAHNTYYNLHNYKGIDAISEQLEIDGVYLDYKELKNIEKIIVDFHKNQEEIMAVQK
jgi:glycosyltransferase domain-containing protein